MSGLPNDKTTADRDIGGYQRIRLGLRKLLCGYGGFVLGLVLCYPWWILLHYDYIDNVSLEQFDDLHDSTYYQFYLNKPNWFTAGTTNFVSFLQDLASASWHSLPFPMLGGLIGKPARRPGISILAGAITGESVLYAIPDSTTNTIISFHYLLFVSACYLAALANYLFGRALHRLIFICWKTRS